MGVELTPIVICDERVSGRIVLPEGVTRLPGPPVPSGQDSYWYGRKHSPESIEANRQWHLGRRHTEEHNAKIRDYRHTKEAKLNIRENHHFAKNGRLGHGNVMREFYKQHPEMSSVGKTWKKDPITGKRIWMEKAKA